MKFNENFFFFRDICRLLCHVKSREISRFFDSPTILKILNNIYNCLLKYIIDISEISNYHHHKISVSHFIAKRHNKREAFEHYLKSAEMKNSNGVFKTAICYYYGIGVEKDINKYLEWIKK